MVSRGNWSSGEILISSCTFFQLFPYQFWLNGTSTSTTINKKHDGWHQHFNVPSKNQTSQWQTTQFVRWFKKKNPFARDSFQDFSYVSPCFDYVLPMKSSIFHGHQPQVAPRDPITRDDQRPHGLGCTGQVPFEYGKPNIQICLSNFNIRKYCSVPTIIQGSMGNSRLFHWEHVDSKGPIRISAVQLETTYVRTHAWKPTCHTICVHYM